MVLMRQIASCGRGVMRSDHLALGGRTDSSPMAIVVTLSSKQSSPSSPCAKVVKFSPPSSPYLSVEIWPKSPSPKACVIGTGLPSSCAKVVKFSPPSSPYLSVEIWPKSPSPKACVIGTGLPSSPKASVVTGHIGTRGSGSGAGAGAGAGGFPLLRIVFNLVIFFKASSFEAL
eukprot:TRINITY_DN5554_c0_g1_i1.p1 TRINITY_DN5554_c0_g1~~TRINITY_DN5554_c0_g1_i1.p1  ORF type:complete len:173 (+),score=37.84 TRINITY_DN5554_c0_g1_i1:27-545(+)